MNLPPVPGSLPPVPSSSPSAPAPPPTARPRARLILAAGVIVVGLLVAFGSVLSPQPPGTERVNGFVRSCFARDGIKPDNVWIAGRTVEARRATFEITVETSRAEEARYGFLWQGRYAGDTPTLPDWLNLDVTALARCQRAVAGPHGDRLCQLAGLNDGDLALVRMNVLRELAPASLSRTTTTGIVTAERHGLRWTLAWNPRPGAASAPSGQAAPGRRLGEFTGEIRVLERPADKARLLELAGRLPEIARRLDETRPALLADAKPGALALLKPGAFFAGTASGPRTGQTAPARVFLDITEVRDDPDGVKLSALLRNDGSWRETRLFAGALALDDDGALALALIPQAVDGTDNAAGPFMADYGTGFELPDSNGQRVLSLKIDGTALTWASGDASLRLEPATAEARAAIAAEFAAAVRSQAAAVRPGRCYAGGLTDRLTGRVEPWILRFTEFDEQKQTLAAELERGGAQPAKLTLTGILDTNRYRNENGSVVFTTCESPVPDDVQAAWDELWPVVLRVEGKRLQMEKPRHLLRFEPAETVTKKEL